MSEEEVKEIARALRRLKDLSDKFDRALMAFEQSQISTAVFQEVTQEFPQQLDRIEQLLLILTDLLGNAGLNVKTTDKLKREIITSKRHSLMRQMSQVQANVNEQEELSALYGINVPLEVTNQIIKLKEKLGQLEQEYRYYTEMDK